jgi:hypothetical protein
MRLVISEPLPELKKHLQEYVNRENVGKVYELATGYFALVIHDSADGTQRALLLNPHKIAHCELAWACLHDRVVMEHGPVTMVGVE